MSKPTEADELYTSLTAGASNPRLKESLTRVKAACDFLEGSQVSITVTAVGKYCADRWKGPKAQSIRNAKDTLFRYLEVRRAKQVLPASSRKQRYEPLIQDETVRAYVALVKSERDEAVRLKNRIIVGLRSLPGLPIDDLIASGFKPVATRNDHVGVGDKARGALARLFSAENLASVGLELYRQRLRHVTTKKVLLEKPDVEALYALMRGGSAGTNEALHIEHSDDEQ